MACNPHQNIINIDFSSNDELNWQYQSINQIHTSSGLLYFNPENDNIVYTRHLGNRTNQTNDKLRLRFFVSNSNTSQSTYQTFNFKIKTGAGLVVYDENVSLEIVNGKVEKFIDREIDIDTNDDLFFELNLNINYQIGLYFKYLILDEYQFCKENSRTYFLLDKDNQDGIFGKLQIAKAVKFQLNSIKVDNIETLTNQFHIDNDDIITIPRNDWYFAKSDDDGNNRQASIIPTLHNAFIKHFGLSFDASNYYAGKPTGTINGNDYGSAIMNIGTFLPVIKDGAGLNYNGSFFVDIDYTKDYYAEFEFVLNTQTNNLYQNPDVNRKYIIKYDKENCKFSYFFEENGIIVDI